MVLAQEQKRQIDARFRKASEFRLAAEDSYESKYWDTSASRAYYAMYHAAVALLMAHGHPEAQEWRSHETVINACIRVGTKRNKWLIGCVMQGEKDFASSFHELYNYREEADYKVNAVNQRKAKKSLDFVTNAQEVINRRLP